MITISNAEVEVAVAFCFCRWKSATSFSMTAPCSFESHTKTSAAGTPDRISLQRYWQAETLSAPSLLCDTAKQYHVLLPFKNNIPTCTEFSLDVAITPFFFEFFFSFPCFSFPTSCLHELKTAKLDEVILECA
jgi:hypothetical protein